MDKLFSLFKQIETEKAPAAPIDFMVVGLGNPGDKYRYTRHNTGFLALSYMAQKLNFDISKARFNALCGEAMLGTHRTLFLLPQTFMNNSGEAVRPAMDFYKIPVERVLVVYDDISLPWAENYAFVRAAVPAVTMGSNRSSNTPAVRIFRASKSASAKSRIPKWILPIGCCPAFRQEERAVLFEKFDKAYQAATLIADGKINEAMNRCNG